MPRPPAARRAALASVASLALAASAPTGCGGVSGPIALGWRFIDGRQCTDTGVAQIAASGPVTCLCDGGACANGCRFACEAGIGGGEGHQVTVGLLGSGTLFIDGFTALGTSIWRGEKQVDSLDPVVIDLYFTGGP